MTKIKLGFCLMICMLSATPAFAIESTVTRVTRVGTTNAGDGFIVETEVTPQSSCTSSTRIFMLSTTTLFRENLAVLLSAFHSNSRVQLYTDACVAGHIAFLSVSVVL